MKAMTCAVKGCERETTPGYRCCDVCLAEFEVLMKNEMANRLGRVPSEAEFEIVLDRAVLVAASGAAGGNGGESS